MFLNDWARAYRQQTLGAEGADATAAAPAAADTTAVSDTLVLGPSRALTDRSCLLLGSAARLARAPDKGVAPAGPAVRLAQGSAGDLAPSPKAGDLAPSPKVLEMVSSSGRKLTIDVRTTASMATVPSEPTPTEAGEESEAGAAVVDAPIVGGGSSVRSCLALQQVPAAGWLPALRQVKKVGTCESGRLP